jgi:hypothetical protein
VSDGFDLWCVHVIGPDDVYPCRTRAHAIIMAADINRKIGQWAASHADVVADPYTPTVNAVVIPWDGSEKSHAEGLVV